MFVDFRFIDDEFDRGVFVGERGEARGEQECACSVRGRVVLRVAQDEFSQRKVEGPNRAGDGRCGGMCRQRSPEELRDSFQALTSTRVGTFHRPIHPDIRKEELCTTAKNTPYTA
ncbi:polyketide synthase [Pseudozyma hubeiensis SY62]|uniref:Polyketide synthase n=1 Tax=Pseudozyma hubeiensis (strain SY62) TaxID=1305764 RepID=R9P220_PSEHS|nr:polyketide synthase [Pseudozyma hubeiensis SY62]GAC95237.1 polyketide synthase [Pseudozyma hubeiensis SY62]